MRQTGAALFQRSSRNRPHFGASCIRLAKGIILAATAALAATAWPPVEVHAQAAGSKSPYEFFGRRTRRMVKLKWQATPRDGLSTVWQASENVTNTATGTISTKRHQFIEIASGLNYLDPATGKYERSQDLIELTSDGGAAALQGPAKLYLKPNLNTDNAVTLFTVSNRVFRTRPLGLFLFDAETGAARLLAPIRDCVGELVPPNRVVWKSAFGPMADLRLTYTKSGIESDVLLRQQPALPAGWDPKGTRLEVWHEWTDCPTPRLTSRVLARDTTGVQPDFTDHILNFGDLWFPTGAAYTTDGSDDPRAGVARTVRVPNLAANPALAGVAKTWLPTSTRDILVESVRWQDLQPRVQGLPPAPQSSSPTQPDRLACLAELPSPRASSQPGVSIQTASAAYRPTACVIDYITVPASASDYTFESYDSYNHNNTYYVSGSTYFSGAVQFSPGCVIKFDPDQSLLIYGSIYCYGTRENPSVFTAWNDDRFGEVLPNSNGYPTFCAAQAVWDYYINSDLTLSGLRIYWAKKAIEFDANYCQYSDTLEDSSLAFCQTGVFENGGNLAIANSTVFTVTTPTDVSGGSTSSPAGTSTTQTTSGCGYLSGSFTDIAANTGDSDGDGLSDGMEIELGADPYNAYSKDPTHTYNDAQWYFTGVTGQSGTRMSIMFEANKSIYYKNGNISHLYFIVYGATPTDLDDIYIQTPSVDPSDSSLVCQDIFENYNYYDDGPVAGGGEEWDTSWHGNVVDNPPKFAVLDFRDRDEDRLQDGYEAMVAHTVVGNPDSSGTGVSDGTDDPDQDGLSNFKEWLYGTNPMVADSSVDSDANGLPDWVDNYITIWRGSVMDTPWADADIDYPDHLPNIVEYDIGTDPLAADFWWYLPPPLPIPDDYSDESAQYVSLQLTESYSPSEGPGPDGNPYFPVFALVSGALGETGAMTVQTQTNPDGSGTAALDFEVLPLDHRDPNGPLYDTYAIYAPFSDTASPDQGELQKPDSADGDIYRDLLLDAPHIAEHFWHHINESVLELLATNTLLYVHAESELSVQLQFRRIQTLHYLQGLGEDTAAVRLQVQESLNIIEAEFTKMTAIDYRIVTHYPNLDWVDDCVGAAAFLATAIKWYQDYPDLLSHIQDYINDVKKHQDTSAADQLSVQIQQMMQSLDPFISGTVPIFTPNPLGWYDGY